MAAKQQRYVVDQFVPVQELEQVMNQRESEGFEMIDRRWSSDSVTIVWENCTALFCGCNTDISDQ